MSLGCTHSPAPRSDHLGGSGGWPWVAWLLCAALSACADGINANHDAFRGDGSLGSPGETIPDDAALPDTDSQTSNDAGLLGNGVRLRVHQGVLNLAHARICYDPDFIVDDPATPEDESQRGPLEPVLLRFNDAGSVSYNESTAYVMLPAMTAGILSVHRAPDPDAGVLSDASLPLPMDAGSGLDAGSAEAGAPQTDASAALDSGGPCDPGSLEAILPLPASSAWFAPDGPEAGVDLARLGFVSAAGDGDSLTLFGSGLALDPVELARRSETARQHYLDEHPGDTEGAAAAARRQEQSLESSYGARFMLSRGVEPMPDRVALSLAHLVPDVPSAGLRGSDSGVDAGSGVLRLCVTVDQKESESGDGGVARFEFRSVMPLGDDFDPSPSYRFRLFAESEYQQGMISCATTSLKPVARLDVDAGYFEPNRSYTLVASGAVAPASTCTGVNASSLIRPSCALAVDKLNAQIQIVPNELPETTR